MPKIFNLDKAYRAMIVTQISILFIRLKINGSWNVEWWPFAWIEIWIYLTSNLRGKGCKDRLAN